jgi:hypothetical protein
MATVFVLCHPEKKEASFAYFQETSSGVEGERGWYQAMAECPDI